MDVRSGGDPCLEAGSGAGGAGADPEWLEDSSEAVDGRSGSMGLSSSAVSGTGGGEGGDPFCRFSGWRFKAGCYLQTPR